MRESHWQEDYYIDDMYGEDEEDTDCKYPDVIVKLVGEDGNAFAILGRVRDALRKAGVSSGEIGQFVVEATSGDYNHLLTVCRQWVKIN